MAHTSITHSLPKIIDVHSSPCVIADAECDPNQWSLVEGEARKHFEALNALRVAYQAHGLDTGPVTLGETHGRVQDGCQICVHTHASDGSRDTIACPPALFNQDWSKDVGWYLALGFTAASWTGQKASVVLRPWEYLLAMKEPPRVAADGTPTNDKTPDAVACSPIVVRPPFQPNP